MLFPVTLRRVVGSVKRLPGTGPGTATRTSRTLLAVPLTVKRYESDWRGESSLFLSKEDEVRLRESLAVVQQCRREKSPVPFSYTSLGKKYGLSWTQVSKLALEWGLREPGFPWPARPKELSDSLRRDWQAVRDNQSYKLTFADLAKTYGIQVSSVHSWAASEGLKSSYDTDKAVPRPAPTRSRLPLETLLSLYQDLVPFREQRKDGKSPYPGYAEIGAKHNMNPVIVAVYDHRWTKEVVIDLFGQGGEFDMSSTKTLHEALETLRELGMDIGHLCTSALKSRYGVSKAVVHNEALSLGYKGREPLKGKKAIPSDVLSDISQYLLSSSPGEVRIAYAGKKFGLHRTTVRKLAHNLRLFGDASKTYSSPKPPQWFLDGLTGPPPTPDEGSSAEAVSPSTTTSQSSEPAPTAEPPKELKPDNATSPETASASTTTSPSSKHSSRAKTPKASN